MAILRWEIHVKFQMPIVPLKIYVCIILLGIRTLPHMTEYGMEFLLWPYHRTVCYKWRFQYQKVPKYILEKEAAQHGETGTLSRLYDHDFIYKTQPTELDIYRVQTH